MFRLFAIFGVLSSLVLAVVAVETPVPTSASKLTNVEAARKQLGLYANYSAVPTIGKVKIAVLDSGFDRVDGQRPYLPKSALVVEKYDAKFIRNFQLGDPEFHKPLVPGDAHGRIMAQIAWAASGSSSFGPQFYLLNANGPTLFRRAVRYAIEQKVDIILFSGTFEGAGNFDGRGPINAIVDDALAAGIIWINAAGNSGGLVHNGPVSVDQTGYLKLRTGDDPTVLRLANRLDEASLTVTLSWNDYRDTEDAGTEKDLDLVVEDWLGRVVGESKLKQVGGAKATGPGESKNPRERLVISELAAKPTGEEYRIRVKAKSNNFAPLDRIRIQVAPARPAPITDPDTGKIVVPVELLDASRSSEIDPPADHAGVLTIGDSSKASSVGPTTDGRLKPDVVLADSVARFSNGEESVGSSNAAAYFAGVVAVMRATEPSVTTAHVREWVRQLDRKRATDVAIAAQPVVPASAPLSPNQERAMRYAAIALEDKKRRGEVNPEIIVSSPGGSSVVSPNSKRTSYSIPAPQDTLVHAAWVTPTPRELLNLVRPK